MNNRTQVICLIIILALNLLAALLYWIFGWFKKKKLVKYTLHAVFIAFCPIIGILYLSLSHFIYMLFFESDIDRAVISFSKNRVDTIEEPDAETELNLVSLEEALVISDKKDLRRLLLSVLRSDINKSLTAVSLALESSDSETSHYAASAIMDIMSDFRFNVQKMQKELQKDPDNVELNVLLIEYLNSFLQKKVLSEIETKAYVYQAEEVCENLYTRHKEDMEARDYLEMVNRFLDIGEIEKAENWAGRIWEEHRGKLDAYTARLKVLYSRGNREEFLNCLDQLKQTDIIIDRKTLELIRFYS